MEIQEEAPMEEVEAVVEASEGVPVIFDPETIISEGTVAEAAVFEAAARAIIKMVGVVVAEEDLVEEEGVVMVVVDRAIVCLALIGRALAFDHLKKISTCPILPLLIVHLMKWISTENLKKLVSTQELQIRSKIFLRLVSPIM